MTIELPEILNTVAQRIEKLRDQFTSVSIIKGSELFLNGALKTGLYSGPKPKRLSLNKSCPYEHVIEADIRLLLPLDKSPHDPKVLASISKIFKPQAPLVITQTYHWDRTDIQTARFYKYQHLGKDLGLEWELAVCKQPYVDIALFWKDLFTPEEIEWQKNLRATVYRLPNPLDDEYTIFKNRQNTEARWRLVALRGLQELIGQGKLANNINLPTIPDAAEPVTNLVRKWLAGESGYRTMERPTQFLTPAITKELNSYFPQINIELLSRPPPEPVWVTHADNIQKYFKSVKAGCYTNENKDHSLK